ncbi:MAG: polyprenol monophosphomannose synthase [Candidatus Erginobacter occultus]|nr:polyprenol monophosphomannose synthase [Candidatus Erginobacter occultus]
MKITVMIPTYDEAGNIGSLIDELLLLPLEEINILVVDDDSPDGTGKIAAGRAERDGRVRLLSRKDERGRGRAGRAGFLRALTDGADLVVEMDGDGSHDPADLPRLLEPIRRGEADVVIGSRFVPGGWVEGREWSRDLLSALARCYLRLVLGTPVHDPTSGYRAFKRPALEAIDPGSLAAADPFIVAEVLYRCRQKRLRIAEVPIVFRPRRSGVSKLRPRTLFAYLFRAGWLRLGGKISG